MKYAVDLHIHSALSPCGDNDMTPNNIVNMAVLKGLDVIAVTDHNSAANLEAVNRCALKQGILFIPGMEVETSEEIHMVCLMPSTDMALELQKCVYDALPKALNREDIFGKQLIMDENDEIISEEVRLLITATALDCYAVTNLVRKLGGAVVPAHVDRSSYSMLSNFGMIPEDLKLAYLEISRKCDKYAYRAERPELDSFRLIRSSDAHYLGDILERESMLELEQLSVQAVIDLFNGKV
jgi:hypothetical protein